MNTAAAGLSGFRVKPNLPAFSLALAFFCGGLRTPAEWLAFSVLFLPWAAAGREPLNAAALPAAALFFAWVAIAALFSPAPSASLAALPRYLLPGLAFFCAAAAGEGEKNWLGALAALGAVSAAALIGQKISGRAVVGLIGLNPNYTAAFAAAAFPAALLAAAGEKGRAKLPSAGLAVLLAGGLAASGSRGGMLAAGLASAAALALAGRKRTLALLCAAVLAAFVLLPGCFWEELLKLHYAHAFERPRLWGAALKIAADSPFFGAGPGLFGQAFELFKFRYFDGISFYGHSTLHGHGELFNLAAEAGFPAAVFFAAAALGGLRAGVRRSLPLAACALALFIQGTVDVVFYSGAVALLFWGTLGFLVPRGPAAGGDGRPARAALAALCLAGILSALFPGAFSGGAAGRYAVSAQAAAAREPVLNLALLRRAALDGPKDPFAARAAAAAAAAAGDLERAESGLKAALALEPLYAGARLDLAKVHAARGRRAEGCAELGPLARPLAARAGNEYQRELTGFDRMEFVKLKKDLCR